MRFAVPHAVAFVLPVLLLPAAAHAAPKPVGTITSSNNAVVSHNGNVNPALPNTPVYDGDKVMTLSGGSANVQFGNHDVHMGGSSMTDSKGSLVTMDSQSNGHGQGWNGADDKLADAEFRHHHDDGDDDDDDCFTHFPHGFAWGWHHGHFPGNGHGRGHGHGHHHCPVSP